MTQGNDGLTEMAMRLKDGYERAAQLEFPDLTDQLKGVVDHMNKPVEGLPSGTNGNPPTLLAHIRNQDLVYSEDYLLSQAKAIREDAEWFVRAGSSDGFKRVFALEL